MFFIFIIYPWMTIMKLSRSLRLSLLLNATFLLFFLLNSAISHARQPKVVFQANSKGCKGWHKPNTMVSLPQHSGPADSGPQINSIDWAHCSVRSIDPRADNYLWIKGSNTFDQTIGTGKATLSIKVRSFETSPFGLSMVFPYATVFPSAGGKVSIALDSAATSEVDREFTYLVNQDSNYTMKGGWIHLPNGVSISTSAEGQLKTNVISSINDETFFDISNVYLHIPFQSESKQSDISYSIISPEYCTLEERLGKSFSMETLQNQPAELALRTVICLELIPSSRTEGQISWSNRKDHIFPKVSLLENIKEHPDVLNIFKSEPFTLLLTHAIEKKLKLFYRWSNQNFDQHLTQLVQQYKDLSKLLNSKANPLSYRRMIETLKSVLNDQSAREELVKEILETARERRDLSANVEYLSFLDQIEFVINQGQPLSEDSLNDLIKKIEKLSESLDEMALALLEERDGYKAKM